MRKIVLLITLACVFALPAFSQTPDITGTWTGTGIVNSDYGIVNLTVTLVVSNQTDGSFLSSVQIESSDGDPVNFFSRIDSNQGQWQLHGAAYSPWYGQTRMQGYFTPAVGETAASVTLDAEYLGSYSSGGTMQFAVPCIFHVILTQ